MYTTRIRVNPRLRDLPDLFKPSAEMNEAIGKTVDVPFREQSKELFATEGASGGPKWEKLTEPYRTRKEKKFPGRKILTRRGRMRDAFSTAASPDHIAEVMTLGPTKIMGRWGAWCPPESETVYFVYHLTGTLLMVARDPIQRTAKQIAELMAAFRRAMDPFVRSRVRGMARAGLFR